MANQFLYLFLTKYESMKNMLKHAVPAIWILFGTLWGQHAAAAIDAKISFETEIPKAFVCGENSTAARPVPAAQMPSAAAMVNTIFCEDERLPRFR